MTAKTYRIRPLVWIERQPNNPAAQTILGAISIWRWGARWWWDFDGGAGATMCNSLEHGKQLAEAFVLAKMMEFLEEFLEEVEG